MQDDHEGFRYPIIDKTSCISCGLCEKVCPIINVQEKKEIINAYGIKNNSHDIVMKSSSGGFFSTIAEYIISQNGIVFGACFDKDWNVIIDYTDNINEINKFRGSKYVQAKVNNAYNKVKEFLKADKLVLYSGTPCQIKALKNFLHNEYDNLICLDFICHGIPSSGVWHKYIKELNIPHISSINFRNKEQYSWENFSFQIKDETHIKISEPHSINPYMKGFLSNITIRPSCSVCPAKAGKSNSDITMADFWGIKEINKDFYDPNGVSLVFSLSRKGDKIIKELNCKKIKVNTQDVKLTNISFNNSSPLHPNRTQFFNQWKSESIIPLLKILSKASLSSQIKYLIRVMLVRLGLNYRLNKILNKLK